MTCYALLPTPLWTTAALASGCPRPTMRSRSSQCQHTRACLSYRSARKCSINVRILPGHIYVVKYNKLYFLLLTTMTGSRRLITYRRLPNAEVDAGALAAAAAVKAPKLAGQTADDLNPFRRGYFRKFELPEGASRAKLASSTLPPATITASTTVVATPEGVAVFDKSKPTGEDNTEAEPQPALEPPEPLAAESNVVPADGLIPQSDSRLEPAVTSAPAPAPD